MSKFTYFFMFVMAVVHSVYAFTEEDKTAFNEAVKPFILECAKEHGITNDDLKAAKEAGTSIGLPPCFLACGLKKEKILNDQGVYVTDALLPMLKQLIKNKDDLAHLEDVLKICLAINDKPVSDGAAGCDRAHLFFTCIRDHKAEIPL